MAWKKAYSMQVIETFSLSLSDFSHDVSKRNEEMDKVEMKKK